MPSSVRVCGSYTDMNAGTPAEALMDFTGGIHMCIQLSDPPPDLWRLMSRAGNYGALLSCSTPQGESSSLTLSPNGLVEGHAYTVTGVIQMMSRGKPVKMLRLWNPWGKGEWNGDWSDRSSLWQTVNSQDREKCLSVADDGEFWMTLEDFSKFFTDLDICGLNPNFLDEDSSSRWTTSVAEGRWVAGTTAGGCMNYKDSFWTNPQYRVKLCGEKAEKNILVSLMQKSDKRNRHLVQNLHIGFSIFEHRAHRGKFTASFFSSQQPVAQTKTFMNAREVMELLTLKPGEYMIVPSTFHPNETASFLLTILCKTETRCYENSGERSPEPVPEVPDHIITDHVWLTRHCLNSNMADVMKVKNRPEDENKNAFFRQHSDKYEEMDAEQLQRILNEKLLKGDLKSGGFSIDACRSMVALMDTSVTGRLNSSEFIRLWNKVVIYKVTTSTLALSCCTAFQKYSNPVPVPHTSVFYRRVTFVGQDIFFQTDVSRTGTLSLTELRNAVVASGTPGSGEPPGMRVSDDTLNLMALRYGASSGHMTLESFISLILRLDCMFKIFRQLSDGKTMSLQESEVKTSASLL
ncbi:hypothetical protein CCH79_00004321 [Gambusia affinis]|uniref:Calpain catalytic domain-containing protein n=1 Tax=Gambusia affinis TaxID=33528 RepID=A0A315UYS6_GAMAF|nr:hypothetical protein CCH79_00004321 [Gambusia affinis]